MDLTRANQYMQKKAISVFSGVMTEGTSSTDVPKAAGNHKLANLPAKAIITNAYVQVITVSNATTNVVQLGTAEGGAQILTSANVKTLGKQGTFVGNVNTDTGVELWMNVARTGTGAADAKYVVVVEYLEYDKNTGEYTKV